MDIDELINKSNEQGNEVWISGGVEELAIETLESKIGFRLPESYREFLKKYGGIGVYDNFISGIVKKDPLEMRGGNMYADTLFMRDDYSGQYTVPDYLWVVEKHEDGAFCFNKNLKTGSDELAIINYEPHLSEKTLTEVISPTFESYIKERFFYGIE
jgi:hypothetical protein